MRDARWTASVDGLPEDGHVHHDDGGSDHYAARMSQLRKSSLTLRRLGFERIASLASRMRHTGIARRNSGEGNAVYAASRINQLRKSSSAASQLRNTLRINSLQG